METKLASIAVYLLTSKRRQLSEQTLDARMLTHSFNHHSDDGLQITIREYPFYSL
jgi:hypothetical protein